MPHFGSLKSYEQLDALARRYNTLPSTILRRSYADYCIDEACAVAGEAKDRRLWEQAHSQAQEGPAAPVKRRNGQLIGAFHRET